MHNADLCDTLGNLVHRATNLCNKYCGGIVPDVPPPTESPIDLAKVVDEYEEKMENFELQGGAYVAIRGFHDVNGYLTKEAPWLKKGDEYAEFRQITVRATLEAIYALAHLLLPFVPVGASSIFRKLNTEPCSLVALSKDCRNLKVGTKIVVGDILYQKLASEEERLSAEAAAQKKKEAVEQAQRRKQEKKAAAIAASAVGQKAPASDDQPEFTKIDIRVGQITKVREAEWIIA
jgi:methionyl-tRNA synthetase